MKTLEISVNKGNALYIPAYWWYSIQFNKNCSISVFQYRTYMNTVAISPQLGMRLLQSQNVKRETIKKQESKNILLKQPEVIDKIEEPTIEEVNNIKNENENE